MRAAVVVVLLASACATASPTRSTTLPTFAETGWTMQLTEKRRTSTDDMAVVLLETAYADRDTVGAEVRTQNHLLMVFRRIGGTWRLVHDQNTRMKHVE